MSNKKIFLPHLPFGNSLSNKSDNITLFSQNLSHVVTSLQYYDIHGKDKTFSSQSYVFQLNGFKAVASANTPVTVMVGDTNDVTLMIPFYGESLSTVESKDYRWKANHHAILLPKTSRGGGSTLRSTLTIDINPEKFIETAKLMIGVPSHSILDVNLNVPQLIPLSYGNVSFIEPIKNLCQLIDFYQCNATILKHFNIDELFYRLIVTMLLPEKFLTNELSEQKPKSSARFNHLIDYSTAHPASFNTLSDLEKFTGLSTRSLQYAFTKTLNMTPKQWLRQLKMKQARDMIMAGHGYISVTQAAMECGFTNFSLFSKYYREQFGELPSETLKKMKF